MKEYQQKHVIRTLFYSRMTIVILFLAIVLLFRSVMELNDKRIQNQKLAAETRKERTDMEQKVAQAKDKDDFMATDRGFEAYVRTTYPVVKEGEGVIVVYDAEKSSVTDVRTDISFFEKITLFFKSFIK